jgi:hypothetical protein
MLKDNYPREPHKWHNNHPLGEQPAPPHLSGDNHQPPHIRASRIRLSYDDETITKLKKLYTDANYLAEIIEACPPEIILTFAMLLEIKVDLSEYPKEVYPIVRFATPFLNKCNSELIGAALNCNEADVAISIYNDCPPEQALLALTVAAIKTAKEVENQ